MIGKWGSETEEGKTPIKKALMSSLLLWLTEPLSHWDPLRDTTELSYSDSRKKYLFTNTNPSLVECYTQQC